MPTQPQLCRRVAGDAKDEGLALVEALAQFEVLSTPLALRGQTPGSVYLVLGAETAIGEGTDTTILIAR
jgi:hypothetical protein